MRWSEIEKIIEVLTELKIPHHNGMPLTSGVNDCHWCFLGKCTNPKVTRNKIPVGYSRDWDSKQNCTLSLWGVAICGGFKFVLERFPNRSVGIRVNRVLHENEQGAEEQPTKRASIPDFTNGGGI